MNTAEEIVQQVELIARQKALEQAVKITTTAIANKHTVEVGVIDTARLFYDFLRGDVETESEPDQ